MPSPKKKSARKSPRIIGSPAMVWHGTADHTKSGLRKSDFLFNKKTGCIVSKLKHEHGKRMWAKNKHHMIPHQFGKGGRSPKKSPRKR
jgi:hypothetical protein